MSEPSPYPLFDAEQVLTSESLDALSEYLDRRLRIHVTAIAISATALLAAFRWMLSRAARDRVTVDGTRWTRVHTLTASGPTDRHFVVDPGTGSITFGDGEHGAAVPPGARIEANYRLCCRPGRLETTEFEQANT
ncbi:MAG: hypothetical protein HKN93_04970 [Acidimicrobiia bacterium]|nr:hypothetical protein [Acidimicrobiia bacterium]